MNTQNDCKTSDSDTRGRSFYNSVSDLLETLARVGFWIGKYILIQLSILGLIAEGLFVWYDGTKRLIRLFITRQLSSATVQSETIGVMETYLSAILLFILAMGLHGIFVVKPSEQTRLPVEIRSVAELDTYLFSAITSVLLVAALRQVLSPSHPFNWNIIIAACAVVIVISIYLACKKRFK